MNELEKNLFETKKLAERMLNEVNPNSFLAFQLRFTINNLNATLNIFKFKRAKVQNKQNKPTKQKQR